MLSRAHHREQWLEMEMIGYHHQLLEGRRKAVLAVQVRAQKQGQAITLMPPEVTVGNKIVSRVGDVVSGSNAQLGQALLSFSQQVLEADRVLLNFTAGTMGGKKNRDTGLGPWLEKVLKV